MSKATLVKDKPLARESVKVRRARRRIAALLNEESARITPEALSIERKKIQRRLEEGEDRVEVTSDEVSLPASDLEVVS